MKESAGLSPKTHSLGLDVPGFAQERPSCGGHSRTSLVLARGNEKEAASSVQTTKRFAGRPRKVSQGTTDAIPKNLMPRYQRTKSGEGRFREDEKTNARHCGRKRSRTWGPLSRTTSRRVGCFWEEMQGAAKVFIKKDGKMEEVQVVKLIERGRERFWFEEKKDRPQQPKEDEEPATRDEEVTVLEEDTPEEIEAMNKRWLKDRVTSPAEKTKTRRRGSKKCLPETNSKKTR